MGHHPRTVRGVSLAVILTFAGVGQAAFGQYTGGAARSRLQAGSTVRFKSPTPHQVFQRDASNRATVPVTLPDDLADHDVISGFLSGPGFTSQLQDGKFSNVPSGGPYTFQIVLRHKTTPLGEAPKDKEKPTEPTKPVPAGPGLVATPHATAAMQFEPLIQVNVGPFYVGDLWVLAGQSNMEGYGNLEDLTPPVDRVSSLGMDGKWVRAQEPLHWLVDSPDPVHSGDPSDRAKRSAAAHTSRNKGAGLGLPFAVVLSGWTNVPIGLIPCAHGGTSMSQWDPAKKAEGGKSLYGSMIRQIQLAGGKVKGVLWYQGESDADPAAAPAFAKRFADFIASVRTDLGNPELPFYYVQLGRHVTSDATGGWNTVQEAQRKLSEDVANTAMIAVVDLELDDGIHIGTEGLKRAGVRLARVAARELFGQAGASAPSFDRVTRGTGNTLLVRFKGVNRAPAGSPNARMMMSGSLSDIPSLTSLGPVLSSRSVVYNSGGMGSSRNDGTTGSLDGLQPVRHIGGFSIRKADGTDIPLIFEAGIGTNHESVVLRLNGEIPPGSFLWYGHGRNPYCNLTDALDMAVPVFGPIPLDAIK